MNFKFPFFSKKQKIVATTEQIVDSKGRKLSDILKSEGSSGGSGGSGGSGDDGKPHVRVDAELGSFPQDSLFVDSGYKYMRVQITQELLSQISEGYSFKDVVIDVYCNNEYVSSYPLVNAPEDTISKGFNVNLLGGYVDLWYWEQHELVSTNDYVEYVETVEGEEAAIKKVVTIPIPKIDYDLLTRSNNDVTIKASSVDYAPIHILHVSGGISNIDDYMIIDSYPIICDGYLLGCKLKITSLDDISFE